MNTTAHSVAGSCQVASVVAGAGGVWFPPPLLQRTPLAVSPLTVNDGPGRWAPKAIRATYRTLGEGRSSANRKHKNTLFAHTEVRPSPGMRRRGKQTRLFGRAEPCHCIARAWRHGRVPRGSRFPETQVAGVAPGPYSFPSPRVLPRTTSAPIASVPQAAAIGALFSLEME